MSLDLALLIVCAVACVGAVSSLVIGASLPFFDVITRRIAARNQARVWLVLNLLPLAAGVLAIGAALLPALGFGVDHCVQHGMHHPHICVSHPGAAPSLFVVAIAAILLVRVGGAALSFGLNMWRRGQAARGLAASAAIEGDLSVLPLDAPQAFVIGLFRPRVFVSRGLLALDAPTIAAVVDHERAHIRHRDLVWRGLGALLGSGHLPFVRPAVHRRLVLAQEMAADVAATRGDPGARVTVAEALVALARGQSRACPEAGLAFSAGDVAARVKRLLGDPEPANIWNTRHFAFAWLLLAGVVAVAHGAVHHGLETIIGVLS